MLFSMYESHNEGYYMRPPLSRLFLVLAAFVELLRICTSRLPSCTYRRRQNCLVCRSGPITPCSASIDGIMPPGRKGRIIRSHDPLLLAQTAAKSLSTTNGTMRKGENLINYIAARKYIHITIAVQTLSRVWQWLLSDEEEEFSRC